MQIISVKGAAIAVTRKLSEVTPRRSGTPATSRLRVDYVRVEYLGIDSGGVKWAIVNPSVQSRYYSLYGYFNHEWHDLEMKAQDLEDARKWLTFIDDARHPRVFRQHPTR